MGILHSAIFHENSQTPAKISDISIYRRWLYSNFGNEKGHKDPQNGAKTLWTNISQEGKDCCLIGSARCACFFKKKCFFSFVCFWCKTFKRDILFLPPILMEYSLESVFQVYFAWQIRKQKEPWNCHFSRFC